MNKSSKIEVENKLISIIKQDEQDFICLTDMVKGEMPNNKLKLIQAWVEIHQEDLMADWKLAVEGQQLHKIEPLR